MKLQNKLNRLISERLKCSIVIFINTIIRYNDSIEIKNKNKNNFGW